MAYDMLGREFIKIHFDNFTLRPLGKDDGLQFFNLIDRNRMRLRDYFPGTTSDIVSLAASFKYVDEKLEQAYKKEHFCFVIEDETNNLQGLLIIKNIDWRVPKGELAYFIDRALEGKGIMTKALAHLANWCFQTLGMNKLFILTATDNEASRKTAEKNGFTIEGILRKNFRIASGELVDMVYYGLLNNNFL